MAEVSFRSIRDVDVEQVTRVLAHSLSNTGVAAKTVEYFRWKHVRNPFGVSTGLVAISKGDERVVATRPLMKWKLASSEMNVDGFRPVDTATDSEWRGRGLFKRMTRAALEELESQAPEGLIFNTPNANSLPGYLKMGWSQVCILDLRVRPGSCIAWLRSLLGRTSSAPAESFLKGGMKIIRAGEMSADLRDRLISFCSRSDSVRVRRGLRTVRTEDYVRWRYFEHPNVDYMFSVCVAGGQIQSVVVAHEVARRRLKGVLVDEVFCARDDCRDYRMALSALIRSVPATFFAAHAHRASAEGGALRSLFFVIVKRVPVVARRLAHTSASLDLSAWDLSLGDLDGM